MTATDPSRDTRDGWFEYMDWLRYLKVSAWTCLVLLKERKFTEARIEAVCAGDLIRKIQEHNKAIYGRSR